jgi:hypothetical protein
MSRPIVMIPTVFTSKLRLTSDPVTINNFISYIYDGIYLQCKMPSPKIYQFDEDAMALQIQELKLHVSAMYWDFDDLDFVSALTQLKRKGFIKRGKFGAWETVKGQVYHGSYVLVNNRKVRFYGKAPRTNIRITGRAAKEISLLHRMRRTRGYRKLQSNQVRGVRLPKAER